MSQSAEANLKYMRRALELAQLARGMTSPNPMVGAVLVKDGQVIGEGYHVAAGLPHAEVQAIRNCVRDVAGATLYVTLEPCCHQGRTPPCVPLLVEKKIAKVYAAMLDPNDKVGGKGVKQLKAAGIKVEVGLCEAESRKLNEFFVAYHEWQRPFVICKWAMTLDGKTATQTGQSRWISDDLSRAYVHEVRSRVDAIMVGIGTILADDPRLNVRIEGFHGRQPRPIIIDGALKIPVRAQCLTQADVGGCIVATTGVAPKDRVKRLRDAGHNVIVLKGRRGVLDLRDLFRQLHKLEIQSVFCEGGGGLNGSLFRAQLVDKVIAFVAPKCVGGSTAKTPISGWGVSFMEEAVELEDVTVQQFGRDVCMEGYVAGKHRRLRMPREVAAVDENDQEDH